MPEGLLWQDFAIQKVSYDKAVFENTSDEGEFNNISIEFFKELAQYTCIVSCVYKYDDGQKRTRLWTRDEAILGGLLVRGSKLMSGFLEAVCNNRMELALIFTRCLVETMINLKYLLTFQSPELFREFIVYSLRTEKKLHEAIEHNILERGQELPIETRMKASISMAFSKSGISIDDVDSSERDVWGESIYKRFKKLGMEKGYLPLFSLYSHFVHGNWQEILRYHLDCQEEGFAPHCEWESTRPQPIFALGRIIGETTLHYAEEFLPDCWEAQDIKNAIQDCIARIVECDQLHEAFLQKSHSK